MDFSSTPQQKDPGWSAHVKARHTFTVSTGPQAPVHAPHRASHMCTAHAGCMAHQSQAAQLRWRWFCPCSGMPYSCQHGRAAHRQSCTNWHQHLGAKYLPLVMKRSSTQTSLQPASAGKIEAAGSLCRAPLPAPPPLSGLGSQCLTFDHPVVLPRWDALLPILACRAGRGGLPRDLQLKLLLEVLLLQCRLLLVF